MSALAIVAFVLAFLVWPLGLILGIVASIVVGTSKGRLRGIGFGIAATMVSLVLGILTAVALPAAINKSRVKHARMGACTMRSAVQLYMADHPRQCPSTQDLMDGYLDSRKRVQDPWNQDYEIDCSGADLDVFSKGKTGLDHISCEKSR